MFSLFTRNIETFVLEMLEKSKEMFHRYKMTGLNRQPYQRELCVEKCLNISTSTISIFCRQVAAPSMFVFYNRLQRNMYLRFSTNSLANIVV